MFCNARRCRYSFYEISLECFNYTLLNDSNRARTYKTNSVLCTDSALSGWYRFGGEAGSQMANSCVQMYHCGASYPGWLSGGHPAVADGTVVRKVCFNFFGSCCERSLYISVRNCGGFYVYNLTPLPSCGIRYCAGNGSEPTTGRSKNEVISQFAVDYVTAIAQLLINDNDKC